MISDLRRRSAGAPQDSLFSRYALLVMILALLGSGLTFGYMVPESETSHDGHLAAAVMAFAAFQYAATVAFLLSFASFVLSAIGIFWRGERGPIAVLGGVLTLAFFLASAAVILRITII